MFRSVKMVIKCLLFVLISIVERTSGDNYSSSPTNANLVNKKVLCSELPNSMVRCTYNSTACAYGDLVQVYCVPLMGVKCLTDKLEGENLVKSNRSVGMWRRGGHYRTAVCRFCHQVDGKSKSEAVNCDPPRRDCSQPGVARSFYMSTCRVGVGVVCMGKRQFYRMQPCHRSSGKNYGSTMTLSLFLGGLGADRFYLGMWREGLGKLFTFGGLGVWSLLDFILVAVGYICPRDDLNYWNDP